MYKTTLDRALEEGHTRFLVDAIRTSQFSDVTQWVKNTLMSGDLLNKRSKDAFFNAEKSLIVEYIMEQDLSGLTNLLNAVDNEQLKSEINYNRLKLNQCRVLTDAMKRAERFLKEDNIMHEGLRKLLEDRQKELQGMKYTEEEQKFKDNVSTVIDEALKIVSVVPVASSSQNK